MFVPIVAGWLVFAAGRDKSHYELWSDQRPIYRKTVFVGIGADVDDLKQDRFARSVGEMNQVMFDACGQHTSTLILGDAATPAKVMSTLQTCVASDEDDRVVIDLVCHGEDSGSGPKFRFVGGTLLMENVKRVFQNIPARHKLLIVDGCDSSALLSDAKPWNPPVDWKEAVDHSCAVIVSSSPPAGNPASIIGGTEFHNRLTKQIRDMATFGKTTASSDVLLALRPRIGAFGADTSGDLVFVGDTSRNPDPVGIEREASHDSKNLESSRAYIAQTKTQLSRSRLVDDRKYLGLIKATLNLTVSEQVAAINDVESWADLASRDFTPLDYTTEYREMEFCLGKLYEQVGTATLDNRFLVKAASTFRALAALNSSQVGGAAWAWSQRNLGWSLSRLGMAAKDPAALSDAVSAYHRALQGKNTGSGYAADIQSLIGADLRTMAQLKNAPHILEEEVVAFRYALEYYSLDQFPLQYANLSYLLGEALVHLRKETEALTALENSAIGFERAKQPDKAKQVRQIAKGIHA